MTLINVEQSEPKVCVISNDRGDIFFIFKRGLMLFDTMIHVVPSVLHRPKENIFVGENV